MAKSIPILSILRKNTFNAQRELWAGGSAADKSQHPPDGARALPGLLQKELLLWKIARNIWGGREKGIILCFPK